MSPDDPAPRGAVTDRRDLRLFLLGTFGLTWGLGVLGVFFLDALRPVFTPLFFLAVYAPTIVAFVLTARRSSWAGVRALLGSGVRWRVGWRWYLVPFGVVPAVGITAHLIEDAVTGAPVGVSPVAPLVVLAALPLALLVDPGGIGEEFGWRGYALPRMLRLWSWRTSALVLGAVWAVWHLPAFLVADAQQSSLALPPMILQWLATSVIFAFTWLHTRSVLVAGILPHTLLNLQHLLPEIAADEHFTAPLYGLVAAVLLVLGRTPRAGGRPLGQQAPARSGRWTGSTARVPAAYSDRYRQPPAVRTSTVSASTNRTADGAGAPSGPW
ncbi:MAG TPA: type II CAAX endopeptidase family protein [Pseudonocardia sp.]|nr:type II CAAX endopeptidase family protein [Pseudonocardia sp.]